MKNRNYNLKAGDIVMPIDSNNVFDQMLVESINGLSVKLISLSSFNVIRAIDEIEYICSSDEVVFIPFFLIFPYGYYLQKNGDKIIFNRCYENIWAISQDKKVIEVSKYSCSIECDLQNRFYYYESENSPWKNPTSFFHNIITMTELGLIGNLPHSARQLLKEHNKISDQLCF